MAASLASAPVDAVRAFDTQLELARRQLPTLEAANHAGDHHASGLAAAAIRAALRIAERIAGSAEARLESGERDVLDRRLASMREACRSALELAFTPSPAARREATSGLCRMQWDREVAAWRAAWGRTEADAASAERKEGASDTKRSGDHEKILLAALRLPVREGNKLQAWERFDRFRSWLPQLSPTDRRILLLRLEKPAATDEFAWLFHRLFSAAWQESVLKYLRSADETTASIPAQASLRGGGPAARSPGAAAPGAAVASTEPWEHLFGGPSAPVNKLGRVQAPSGRTLLQRPSPDGAPTMPTPLPFDARVMVLRRTTQPTAAQRWCYVTAPDHGAAGFCEERYLAIDPPEPRARLHHVESGETLGKLARDVYGEHITGGNDERLYVQGLYEANKDRAGVKLSPVQLSWRDTWHRRHAAEETLKVYRGIQVVKGMSLWIPSNEFIQRLKAAGGVTTGSSEFSKAWRAAAAVADEAIEVTKYAAGFTLGLLEGAWSAIVDLFKGTAKMVEMVARALYQKSPGTRAASRTC